MNLAHRPRPARPIRNHAYTLIELTIVVLVILILLGLAVPRFSSIADSAKQAQCLANIRSVDGAISQWEEKNKAEFPQGWISLTGLGRGGDASYDLTAFVKDISVFNCPAADRAGGEYYYVKASNDKKKRYNNWFPGCNCWYLGRPGDLGEDYPHTTFTADPY